MLRQQWQTMKQLLLQLVLLRVKQLLLLVLQVRL
jgi:hypothetical protein